MVKAFQKCIIKYNLLQDFPVAQTAKYLLAMQETRVLSLGREDALEKAMVTHFSTLAWKIPWTEEPGRPQSMESKSWTQLKDRNHHHHYD